MFDDIANTLKVFSKLLLVVLIILSLVACIAILVYNSELFLVAVIMLIGGIVSALVGSSCLYGFGELIEKATIIEANTRPASAPDNSKTSTELYTSNSVRKPAPPQTQSSAPLIDAREKGTCDICWRENIEITRICIKNDSGTKYRKMCPDCKAKWEQSITEWTCHLCGSKNPKDSTKCGKCSTPKR